MQTCFDSVVGHDSVPVTIDGKTLHVPRAALGHDLEPFEVEIPDATTGFLDHEYAEAILEGPPVPGGRGLRPERAAHLAAEMAAGRFDASAVTVVTAWCRDGGCYLVDGRQVAAAVLEQPEDYRIPVRLVDCIVPDLNRLLMLYGAVQGRLLRW